MTTIVINDTYTVTAGTTLDFNDQAAFNLVQLEEDVTPTLVNAGTVKVTSDAAEGGITGIESFTGTYISGEIWNQAGGSFSVVAGAGDENAYGAILQFETDTVINDGDWSVTATKDADGLSGDTLQFTNTGHFEVHGGASAVGLGATGWGSVVTNSGTMLIQSDHLAQGIMLQFGGGSFINSGHLTVEGGSAQAVVLGYEFSFSNTGTITAITTGDNDSVAVWISKGYAHPFDNSGVITGDYAFKEASGTGVVAEDITNTGHIFGITDLGPGNDILTNSGVIHGDVLLGDDADTYDGARGKLFGVLSGGAGDDTLAGGKGGDVIYGDAQQSIPDSGDDLISGGKGADSLFGGAGSDTLTGGVGADQLTGDGGADVFQFLTLKDSKPSAPDLITDLSSQDSIDLHRIDADTTHAGDQAFTLVAAFDGHAGELTLSYDAGSNLTTISGDVNGDGAADLVIHATGDHHDFTNFVL